jgi:hypothetical protein
LVGVPVTVNLLRGHMTSCELSSEKKVLLNGLDLNALDLILNILRTHGQVHVENMYNARIPSLAQLVMDQLNDGFTITVSKK